MQNLYCYHFYLEVTKFAVSPLTFYIYERPLEHHISQNIMKSHNYEIYYKIIRLDHDKNPVVSTTDFIYFFMLTGKYTPELFNHYK